MTTKRGWSPPSPRFVGIVVGCLQPIAFVLFFLFGGQTDSSGPLPAWARVAWGILWFPLGTLNGVLRPDGTASSLGLPLILLGDSVLWGIAAAMIASRFKARAIP